MTVAELIEQLQQQRRSATVYVQASDPDGLPVVVAVEGIAPANSEAYGSAVIIEIED
jgi:hypothetical protein